MYYTKENCPEAMYFLNPNMREKAIHFANNLMEDENISENYAISTGISLAMEENKLRIRRSRSFREKLNEKNKTVYS